MEKLLVKKHLIDSINENQESDGWTNLVKVGKNLMNKGVDYKSMGYDKLFSLVKEHIDCIHWRVDDSNPRFPVFYVREKNEAEKAKYKKLLKAKKNIATNIDPVDALTTWASLGNFADTIQQLKEMALPERWYYSQQNPDYPYPILVSYLKYTFYKLKQEGCKILENENFAAFNTGLVDRRYEPIFALFSKTPNALRNWKLENFCIAGEEREGKELVRQFSPLPKRAHYADKVADMLYDTLAPKPELDWHHIVVENVDRLPFDFLDENCPKNFQLKKAGNLSFDEKEQYFEDLSQAIKSDTKTYRNITNRFKDSLELSLKRIEWNFKTAIPMYFPTLNKMSLLLPLALVDDEKVDIALVVEKTESGNYLGHTILPLEWAYSNARLVCRPDSDWLVAENIAQTITEEDIVEE